MPDDARECLPPDPSVPGLWWMSFATNDDGNGHWEVWTWLFETHRWRRGDEWIEPSDAHALGWRCIAPAVPPDRTL